MRRLIRCLYTFYQSHFFVGLFISLSCMWMYHALGNHAIPFLCWFKGITQGIFVYAVNQRKRKEFFYYHNLGVSKTLLWGTTISIDLFLFVMLMFLAHKI